MCEPHPHWKSFVGPDPSSIARLKCDEAPEEPESTAFEKVLKISCNISNAVNYMQQGIMEVLSAAVGGAFCCLLASLRL